MPPTFFEQPILNSPYEYPAKHWELDSKGQPTNNVVRRRRRAEFITPIPKPKSQRRGQKELVFDEGKALSTEQQQYEAASAVINEIRAHVDRWRNLENPSHWNVTPETARLLRHWRSHDFGSVRPFFCQIEAIETLIWLTEVAPRVREGKKFLQHIETANSQANPGLSRIGLKLATGSGKTTVMAMIIAWQTVNAVRRPHSARFTRGFLIVTPGLTVRDRLRVLQPNDPDSYYQSRELVPPDMLVDVARARIVITNYHAFKLRDTLEISKTGRLLLQGRTGPEIQTAESEGQMLQRVMPQLMAMKNILVLNDEGHHCYRERPRSDEEEQLKNDEQQEAQKNRETARLWISGLEAVRRKTGLAQIIDLSATPFFLRGSGYAEGTLFPWTMCDFSLMDAIECGIVKLPRVPVSDNIPGSDMPIFRNLWEHVRGKMPRKGRGKAAQLDPLSLPVELQTALEALYGHYEKTFNLWRDAGVDVPPCFIIVCNNTSTSKLVYDYVAGFDYPAGESAPLQRRWLGKFRLLSNYDVDGERIPRPRTILIDSEQLESGEALDPDFHRMAAEEIERFRREIVERTGDPRQGANVSDQEILREVMNTVGKKGRLGESIRCVVSVSMLTEGWDSSTVTHVLGLRKFGTQLLCEQVIGRALRRQSYELNEHGLFNVEYADVLGIPFDFNAKPVVASPQPPRETVQIRAITPERDRCEVRFPRVEGYRMDLPEERLAAVFTDDATLVLTPELVGPSTTRNEGIIGEGVNLTLVGTGEVRQATILFNLTRRLLYTKWQDPGAEPKLHLFGQLKTITRHWLENHLICEPGTFPSQLMYPTIADMACENITRAIVSKMVGERPIKAILDPYNAVGSTMHVNFNSSRKDRWKTRSDRSHVNWIILDDPWEAEFCRAVEEHSAVRAYVKNQGLGFEVPYHVRSESRRYRPDFIVLVDDGRGDDDLLHLVIDVNGYRGEDVAVKKTTMQTYWIPAANNLDLFGRWAFAEMSKFRPPDLSFIMMNMNNHPGHMGETTSPPPMAF